MEDSKPPNTFIDLTEQFPEIRNELIAAWEEYSEKVGVIYDPLDWGGILKHD